MVYIAALTWIQANTTWTEQNKLSGLAGRQNKTHVTICCSCDVVLDHQQSK